MTLVSFTRYKADTGEIVASGRASDPNALLQSGEALTDYETNFETQYIDLQTLLPAERENKSLQRTGGTFSNLSACTVGFYGPFGYPADEQIQESFHCADNTLEIVPPISGRYLIEFKFDDPRWLPERFVVDL